MELDLNKALSDAIAKLGDDLQEKVIEEVATRITGDAYDSIVYDIKQRVSDKIPATLNACISEFIHSISDDEFIPVNAYGEKSAPTTLRKEIAKQVAKAAEYSPSYDSYKNNVFTKCVDSIFEEKIKLFREELKKQVDAKFVKEVLKLAEKSLKDKLGI